MLPCEAIETAIYKALITAFENSETPVTIAPFVAVVEGDADMIEIERPCVQFVVEPFVPAQPGAPMGQCTVRIEASTSANDDPRRRDLQSIFETATGVMVGATIGPLVMSPHLVCGINDTGEGGISVDEEERVQRKGKSYDVAIATI